MSLSRNLRPEKASYVGSFIRNQLLATLPGTPAGTDLTGRAAIITGGSSGLGLETAKQFLGLGLSHLILAVRSTERGETVASALRQTFPKARVEVWALEMESYESIQKFTERCQTELGRLDIAILNAGLAELDFSIVPSTGHEKTMQVNYQSTILLALLLLPVLKSKSPAGTPGRLTIVNSAMSNFAVFPNRHKRPLLASFDDTTIVPYDGQERYNVSKLVGQMFIERLAEQIPAEHVTINMVEPGLTKGTNLFRKAKGVGRVVLGFASSLAGRPVEVGALTYVDAAVVKGVDSHGCSLVNCKISPYVSLP